MKRAEIVAPSGNVLDCEQIHRAAAGMVGRGWEVEIAQSVYSSHMRFAGSSDVARLRDFNPATALGENDLVLAARGGYGLNRILPYIDYEGIAKSGTWVAGFSDITLFNLAYLAKCGGRSLQAPTASVLGNTKTDPWTVSEFYRALESEVYDVTFETDAADGNYSGVLWGGNLTVLVSLIGTEYFPKIEGGILFLEDVGEAAYKIERDLMHLKAAGVLDKQSCVVLGAFSHIRHSAHDFGYDIEAALNYFTEEVKVPVVRGLPFGHIDRMCTLTVGSRARLTVANSSAVLTMYEGPNLR